MNIRRAYDQWSRTYDRDHNLTRDLDHQVLRRVLGRRRFEAIVEAGCGTGKNTRLLARLGRRVTALDFSEGMLAQARDKLRGHDHVEFLAADLARRWPCPSQSADLVNCDLVLEHLRNLDGVFAEGARVLREGGWFFICELHPTRQYLGKAARFQTGDSVTTIPAFVHHVSDFTEAARRAGLTIAALCEWWHQADSGKPPRLLSILFEKGGGRPERTRRRPK